MIIYSLFETLYHNQNIQTLKTCDTNEKFNNLICIFIYICISVTSCSKTAIDSRLISSDSIINEYPDSAFAILSSINSDSLKDNNNRALFALLLTQAKYRNYDTIENDSLINIAVNYYADNHDREKLTRSLLFKGAVLSEMGKKPEAIKHFKQAEDNPYSSDYLNLGYINMQIANLYMVSYAEKNIDIEKYKIALSYFRKTKFKFYIIDCLSTIGGLYRKSNMDSAYIYLNEAIALSKETNDSSRLYYNMEMLAEAYYYDSEPIKTKEISLDIINNGKNYTSLNCYHNLIRAYAKIGQIDSANLYLKAISNFANSPKSQITLINTKICILDAQNDNQNKLILENRDLKLADSLLINSLQSNLFTIDKKYDKTKLELENTKAQKSILLQYLIIVCCLIIIIITVLIIIYKQHKLKEQIFIISQIENEAKSMRIKTFTNEHKLLDALNSQIEAIRQLVEYSYLYNYDAKKFMTKFNGNVTNKARRGNTTKESKDEAFYINYYNKLKERLNSFWFYCSRSKEYIS
ncbi:MAG: hypothetical protein PHR45_00805 [Muribaculaceae bacterium]|nr:hypothetical protein [Muribaculaceae bacterium]